MTLVRCSCCMGMFDRDSKAPHPLEAEFKQFAIYFCSSCHSTASLLESQWRETLTRLYIDGVLPKVG